MVCCWVGKLIGSMFDLLFLSWCIKWDNILFGEYFDVKSFCNYLVYLTVEWLGDWLGVCILGVDVVVGWVVGSLV